MRTELHALAEPGVDLTGLPRPEQVVPALLRLVDEDLPSGRYTAAQLQPAVLA